jgi:hypothetical protein
MEVAGRAFDSVMEMADAGKGRGGNRGPNREVQRLYKKYDLNEAGQSHAHDQFSGQRMSIEEIEEIIKEAAQHPKFLKNPPPTSP